MNGITRIWFLVSRISLLLAGIGLLVIAAPHKDPWNMNLVEIKGDHGQQVTISFPVVKKITFPAGIEFPVDTSANQIFMTAFGILVSLVLLTRTGRRAFVNCFRKPRVLPPILLSMAGFLFTLKPTKYGMPIVLYLTFGSVGMLLVLVGIYPFAVSFARSRFGNGIRRIATKIVFYFYNVNIRYFLAAIFASAFILTNLGSYFVFQHIPHIQDSLDQVFHAKILAMGKLTVPSHKYKEFFDFTHMINNGKWYSEYPPGHILAMLVGVIIGMPWIINPLLGSLSVVIFYFIGKEVYDERVGRLASLLGLLSPFIIFMSSEFMSHASALLWLSLFILFFAKTVQRKRIYHPLVAGGALGMAVLGRPMTVLGMGIPFAIYALVLLVRHFREYVFRFSVMFLVVLAFVGVLLLFNYMTNGDPFLFGYVVLHGKGHNPGFGHSGWGEPHTPSKGLRQNLNNLNALNKYLFEWPVPCLFFAFLLFATGKQNKWDYLFISSFWLLSVAYFFYWFQDWCFGPRFMYEASVLMILLTARSFLNAPVLVNETLGLDATPSRVKGFLGMTVMVLFLVGFASNIRPLVKLYSTSYWGVNNSVLEAVKNRHIKNAVVFVHSYYGSVLPANSPTFDGDVIYVRDLGEKNHLMMEYYPGRKYYLADGAKISELKPDEK